jgi:hypothetical protein
MNPKENTIMRLRIDPDFKVEVEALAASKHISVSALTRQLLAAAVAAYRKSGGAPVVDGEVSNGKEAA